MKQRRTLAYANVQRCVPLHKKLISLLLSLVMLLSLLPVSVFAADGDAVTATKITTANELVTGKYVLVASNGYAPTVFSSGWITATKVTESDGQVTVDPSLVWTVTVDGTSATLTDSNGVSVAPKSGNNNGIQSGSYSWAVVCTDGAFTFSGTDSDTTILASNVSSENMFRAYNTAAVSSYPGSYPSNFTLYKVADSTSGGSTVDPEPTGSAYTLTDTLTVGDTVVMYNANSGTLLSSTASGYKLAGVSATPADDVITTDDTTVAWVVGKNTDGNYTFTQGDKVLGMVQSGSYVNMSTNASDGYTGWTLESSTTDNVFYVKNTNMPASSTYGPYYLEYYSGYTAYASNSPSDSDFGISFYKLDDEGGEEGGATYSTIAEALAGASGTSFTVKGVVTLVDGTNIYIQDATGGIDLYCSTAPTDISLGDTVIGTGERTTYNGLPELKKATCEKSSGMTLTAKTVAIGDLATTDICTYVKLSGVEVTEVYDKNGTYTLPNITVNDGTNSIQLYKAVINKGSDGNWEYKVGDKLDITAAVGYYNKYQLRNTTASEVSLHTERENGIVTDLSTLKDGDTVVVFNPANNMAMSATASSTYYRAGTAVTLTDGVLTGFTKNELWTLNITADGNYTFSTADGKKLSMGASYTSIPLDEVNTEWSISAANTDNCVYIKNVARGNYLEWFSSKGNWSSYYSISDETLFAQQLYLVVYYESGDAGELPAAGDEVVIYNQNAKAVLAEQSDTTSINPAAATITDGVATEVENGGVVFTVSKNGDYYRFYNAAYGYLCSNGTGNNAFYSKDFSEDGVTTEDADWTIRTCSGGVGGYEMESRTAKYSDKYSQWLEYYADSFKTYSMYNVTDYTIYSFFFYSVAEDVKLTGNDVVNDPKVVVTSADSVLLGNDYELTFYLDDINEYSDQDVTVTIYETGKEYGIDSVEGETNSFCTVLDAADFVGKESVTVVIQNGGGNYTLFYTITVVDEPSIGAVTPASNSQTGDNKRPEISAELINVGENPTITMTVNDETVTATYADGKVSYTPAADMPDGRTTVTVTVTRADEKTDTKTWSFTVGKSQYQLYFGQLHSHTGEYSDGSGTLADALSYVASLPDSANVDFVAFTDHSNYFDGSKTSAGTANPEGALYDMSLASSDSQALWNSYKSAVAEFNEENAGTLVAIAGFEMTWSGGPGHINTFNTAGIVSRNNSALNNKTSDAGMKAYYALLSQSEGVDSISQFNHPGSTFGTFSDFSYWDAVIDSRIYLVEVGNGEGQIGAGGYYPSYEYYIMALDKGWHVAPSNNQDNHKGKWGNANDARDVILTDNFTEEGIYEAIRALRMYSTEDKNLEITYTVNGLQMGSSISTEDTPEKLNFNVTVYDPDSSDSISKVELVANSGKVAYTWDDPAELASGQLTATLDPTYSYYFVRVTEGDGDLAVTAPVWVGESLKLGISSVESGTTTPVTNEALTLTTTLFNSEGSDATIKSMTYSVKGGEVIGTDNTGYTIPASGTQTVEFTYTPNVAKVMTITVTAVVELDGEEYTFTMDIELDVQDADSLVYIGIDASHYNEYVAGNYSDSMGNFSNLAAEYSIRTVELKTSADLIAACSNDKYKALILTAPSRRDGDALRNPYATYSDEEIAAIVAFNANGGTVILAGWSDFYENYTGTLPASDHMAAQQNKILAALDSNLRISDDATYDDVYSAIDGCEAWRLYFNTYNFDNFLVDGVEVGEGDNAYNSLYTEKFSHYGGASIYTVDGTLPDTVSPVVYGHNSTYSVDVDKDGLGGTGTPKYAYAEGDERLMVMATEQLAGKGLIVVSGAAFMSNFEVQATVEDSGSEKNYSNYKICENLLAMLNPPTITDIAAVRTQTETGYKYTIEGVVTSNASGYDADTAFFDCIYVQDATGGICCFPIAGDYKIGDVVRITGTTDYYQGEPELQVSSIEKIDTGATVTPKEVTAKVASDRSVEGQLITVKGVITEVITENGLVQTIMVRDDYGTCRVFIDGYITTNEDVKNCEVGREVTVTGIASYDDTFNAPNGPFPRIRIRNRADVVCGEMASYIPSGGEGSSRPNPSGGGGSASGTSTKVVESGKTADTSTMGLWMVMLSVSLFGAVTLVRSRKRRA